ncbi:MAG: hypothetical protein AAFN42_24450, partial [Cyanobacteria bacterium J06554_1]
MSTSAPPTQTTNNGTTKVGNKSILDSSEKNEFRSNNDGSDRCHVDHGFVFSGFGFSWLVSLRIDSPLR